MSEDSAQCSEVRTPLTLSEAIDRFLRSLEANGRSALTIDCYRRDLLLLVAFAGAPDVATLDADTVHRFVLSDAVQRTASGKPKQEITIGRTKAALKSFGRYVTDLGWVARDPSASLEIRRANRPAPKPLHEDERKRLVKALNARRGPEAERDRLMLALFLCTGIRLRELVGLNVGDVLLDEKHLRVRAKGGRMVTRFLNSHLRRELRRYLRTRGAAGADAPLIVSARGRRISPRQVQTRFHQWLGWAEIGRPGLTVHSLRHTFGTRVYGRSRDLLQTARAMGHASLESTRVYVELNNADLEEALESL